MSRQRSGIKDPTKFMFSTRKEVATAFRRYCFESNTQLSYALEEAVMDYLVKVGAVPNLESLKERAE